MKQMIFLVVLLWASFAYSQSSLQGGGLSTKAILALEECFDEFQNFTCGPGAGSAVGTLGGTINTVAKFTGATTIGDSLITDTGTFVTFTDNGSGFSTVNIGNPAAGRVTISTSGGDSSMTFEGTSLDAWETAFAFVNPTQDHTITFPDESGTVMLSGSLTTNTLPRWNGTTFVDSGLVDNGTSMSWTRQFNFIWTNDLVPLQITRRFSTGIGILDTAGSFNFIQDNTGVTHGPSATSELMSLGLVDPEAGVDEWGLVISQNFDSEIVIKGTTGSFKLNFASPGASGATVSFALVSGTVALIRTSNSTLELGTVAFASLPAATDGALIYCTDCLRGSAPCSGASTELWLSAKPVRGIAIRWDHEKSYYYPGSAVRNESLCTEFYSGWRIVD